MRNDDSTRPIWRLGRVSPGVVACLVAMLFASRGIGLVFTVVQEPGSYGERDLAEAAERRFADTLNPRYKIQYWAWPATLMRAITTACAETDYFARGKVAASGGLKNRRFAVDGDPARRAYDGRSCLGISDLGFTAETLRSRSLG